MIHAQSSQDELYAYWKTDCAQNTLKMARGLNVPEGTVTSWVSRGRWRARAKAEDTRDFADAVSYARRGVARQLEHSVHVLAAGLMSTIDASGKAMEGTPTPTAVKIARDNLATFGISPKSIIQYESRDGEEASTRAIEAILQSEDEDALLRLLLGEPVPEQYAALEAEVVDILLEPPDGPAADASQAEGPDDHEGQDSQDRVDHERTANEEDHQHHQEDDDEEVDEALDRII